MTTRIGGVLGCLKGFIMFLTSKQLFELKYKSELYQDECLAEIFLLEYNKVESEIDFFEFIKPFYHRFYENKCQIKFDDNSMIIIEKYSNEKSLVNIYHPNLLAVYQQYERS